jgi:hypothetical protein
MVPAACARASPSPSACFASRARRSFPRSERFRAPDGRIARRRASSHPRSERSRAATLQESAGSPTQGFVRSIYGVKVHLSSQLSTTETRGTAVGTATSAYVYDASEIVAVLRDDPRVEIDSSRLFNSDSSEIRVTTRVDLIVPNPSAVVRILGILTP